MMGKKLIVIGNGFDLHLELKSRFQDFLASKSVKEKSKIYETMGIESKYQQFNNISDLNTEEKKKAYIEQINYCVLNHLNYKFKDANIFASRGINKDNNFWCIYFSYLSKFPDFLIKNDKFDVYIDSITLKNWADVEYQIQYLLENSEKVFEMFTNIVKLEKISRHQDQEDALKSAEDKLLDSLSTNNTITYMDVLNLMALQNSIETGWDFENDSIYDFLFDELFSFENMFKTYLTEILTNDYTLKANKLAQKIAESETFNILNFNYTTFYDDNDKKMTNVHSTLNDQGHPIFGISSLGNNGEKHYEKPYYKFTKTFRIMSLSNYNNLKETLPNDIDELIFYGHSLSSTDYLYFETILNKYINESTNKIKLTFKFSNYEENNEIHNVEQSQIISIFKLFNNFDSNVDSNSSFQKLLLEHRINIKELEE